MPVPPSFWVERLSRKATAPRAGNLSETSAERERGSWTGGS
jgi:hypothetical protein